MKQAFWIISILILHLGNYSFAQCNLNGNLKGSISDTIKHKTIDFEVSTSPTCKVMNFGENNYCGIIFPAIDAIWSGNTNDSLSTIIYSFSEPIGSIDIIIGVTGVEGGVAQETFVFITDNNIPEVSVYSGNCSSWTVKKNVTTCPSDPMAYTSIHTISLEDGFSTLTIQTESSGSGPNSNGGSNFAICEGSVAIAKDSEEERKRREAGG